MIRKVVALMRICFVNKYSIQETTNNVVFGVKDLNDRNFTITLKKKITDKNYFKNASELILYARIFIFLSFSKVIRIVSVAWALS
jgi:hypothetical protein